MRNFLYQINLLFMLLLLLVENEEKKIFLFNLLFNQFYLFQFDNLLTRYFALLIVSERKINYNAKIIKRRQAYNLFIFSNKIIGVFIKLK